MRPDHLLTRACTVVHREPGDADEYGNLVPTETLTDTRCYAEQRRSAEPAGVGERAVSDWLIVLPAETTIGIADALTPDGASELEVISDPWPVADPVGREVTHIELIARESG